MAISSISSGYSSLKPDDDRFSTAWVSIINSLFGRWGQGDWAWSEGKSGKYQISRGVVSFSVLVDVTDSFSFALPLKSGGNGMMIICNQSNGDITGKCILESMEAITLHLSGTSVVYGTYEMEKR